MTSILKSNRFPENGKIGQRKSRGVWLEVDRLEPKGQYSRENAVLCCYFCNNDKSDVFSGQEYLKFRENRIEYLRDKLKKWLAISKPINSIWRTVFLRSSRNFFQRLEIVLNRCNIPFEFLLNTKDIWAVDYMPVQISRSNFIQFVYNPDYLQGKKYQKQFLMLIAYLKSIGITTKKSGLKLDGGNISRTKDVVLMCDKVFSENKNISEKELINQLKDLFEVDKLFFVPWDKKDTIGHVDGMARFINDYTVFSKCLYR